MYNRRLHFTPVQEMSYVGPLMEPPLNRLIMLTDYVDPTERAIACPPPLTRLVSRLMMSIAAPLSHACPRSGRS